MAALAGVEVVLSADSARLNRALTAAEARTRRYSRRARSAYQSIGASIGRLNIALGALTALLGAGVFTRTADTFTNINNLLRSSGIEASDLADAFSRVQDVAIGTRSDLESTARLFSTLTRNSESLAASQEQILQVTRTVQQAFALAGASVAEAAGATRQLSQALASGVLRGEELNSVLENAPEIARLIADSLNIGLGELRALAAEGRITSDVVFGALLQGADEINRRFNQTNLTFGQLGNILRAEIIPAFGRIGEAVLPAVATILSSVADIIGVFERNLGSLATVLTGAVAIAFQVFVVRGIRAAIAAFSALLPTVSRAQALTIGYGATISGLSARMSGFVRSIQGATAGILGWRAATTLAVTTGRIATGVFRGLSLAIAALGGPIGVAIQAFVLLATIFSDELVAAFRVAVNFIVRQLNRLIMGIDELLQFFGADGIQFRFEEWTRTVEEAAVEIEQATVNVEDFGIAIEETEEMLSSFEQTLENATDTTARISELGSRAFDGLADSLTDFVTTGRIQVRDFANDLIREFIRIQIRATLARAFTSFGIPGLQAGGPVAAGQPYIVGEAGPELFVPSQAGEVVSNGQLTSALGSGGGQSVTYNINAIDPRSFEQVLAQNPQFVANVVDRGRRQQGRR